MVTNMIHKASLEFINKQNTKTKQVNVICKAKQIIRSIAKKQQ